ncbi:MAG: hypothetical protein IPG92_13610 [Flavobacteriales bacterium]|nr:hypothetical protein [Flavobacteriales bacterium]
MSDKELRVTGVMQGLGIPRQTSPTFELNAHCGCDTVRNVATGLRNAMDFTLRCRTRLRDGSEQAEVVFFTRSGPFQPDLQMVVRGNAEDGRWPLDTVQFTPTRFVSVVGMPLLPDDSGPRDLVLGLQKFSNWTRISPVNPFAGGTVRFTLQWLGGGEWLTLTHTLVPPGDRHHGGSCSPCNANRCARSRGHVPLEGRGARGAGPALWHLPAAHGVRGNQWFTCAPIPGS